ncbi:MAG: hypothetical protein AAF135_15150 [Bacteroidota bacterium]
MALKRKAEDAKRIQARMNEVATQIAKRRSGDDGQRVSSFDPLVYMLLGAAASEFEKISLDIHSSWARMLEHLAQLLTPEVHTGPRPAHAVAHAKAIESHTFTAPTDQLVVSGYKDSDIYLSPAGRYRLVNGEIKYMASGRTLYEIQQTIYKEPLTSTLQGKAIPPYTIWLGIQLPPEEKKLDQIHFFWDWDKTKLNVQSEEFLRASTWTHDGQEMELKHGIRNETTLHTRNSYMIADEFSLSRAVEKEANRYYQPQFLSLQTSSDFSLTRSPFPQAWNEIFDPGDLEAMTQPLVWVQVTFSPLYFESNAAATGRIDAQSTQAFAEDILEQTRCMINCFPVTNRRLHEENFMLSEYINLFELPTSGFFLGIESVMSSSMKRVYQELPFLRLLENEQISVRSYAIRKTGVNRFDDRNAVEILKNLIRFIREENYVFSALGRGVVSNNINSIEKALNDLEGKIRDTKRQKDSDLSSEEPSVYIAFPAGVRENVIINYWSSEGFKGNYIPVDTQADLYSDSPWHTGSIYLVTESIGGRDPLSEMARLHEFKSALITRDRVVTEADMKALCFDELGQSLQEVEITTGIKIGAGPKEGLIRTLEVRLIPKEDIQANQWEFARRKLEAQLNEQAATFLPIRVHVVPSNQAHA